MAEFLGPLCDLVSENSVPAMDFGTVKLPSQAQVPRLVELCLIRMRKDDAGALFYTTCILCTKLCVNSCTRIILS